MNVPESEMPWGGIDNVGTQGSFFVSVNGHLSEKVLGSTNLSSQMGFE